MNWQVSCFVAFLFSFLCCAWIVRCRFTGWLDQPGDRSLHHVAVPRLGGVAIWGGVCVGALTGLPLWLELFDPGLLVAAILLAVVALLDDARSLTPAIRLVCQLCAACVAVFVSGLYITFWQQAWLWAPIGILVYIWGINLYNFMDGMDGFAGGMAVFGFGGLALSGFLGGDPAFAGFNGLLVVANAGFLLWNFPPARLFMGDMGSTLTGFAMVSLSILGWQRHLYPFWVPLLLFSPFWIDATITLAKRIWKREKIWQAHRQHYYQRWVLAGFGHRKVVLVEYSLMVVCTALVMAWQLGNYRYNESVILLSWILVAVIIVVWSECFLRRDSR